MKATRDEDIQVDSDPAKGLLFERPGFLIRRLHQIHVAMFLEEVKSENITPVQYGLMTALAVLPGLDQTALGQEVGLDRTTTADVVKRLEERGLLERRANPADRRTRHVHLTAQGQKLVDTLHGDMARAQDRLLEPLREAEKSMLMDMLRRLVEANNQYSRTILRGV
ncbi:MAG TPA: MarR family transcriptional regulator [Ramlibacter sp.]|nr:MarR family transcriptional regulator [Ramlibacter sp.]